MYNVITAQYIQASVLNWTYMRWYLWYLDNSMRVILQTWCKIQYTSSSLRHVNCGPDHIQCSYSSSYVGYNIQLKVSPLLLEICRQFNARYTVNLVPNKAHMLQFTLCEMCSLPYSMLLQLRLFRLQYSADRISVAIGDMSTIHCSLYCKFLAKYGAHPPVYAMWTVAPDICNVITAPHI
jgi:hypothetical protein